MDYKRLSKSKERYIGVVYRSWRIFLNKDAKFYAINKNDKTPTFTNRTDLNRWIKNRIEQLREIESSQQPELF
jgi:hypothetical protein|tara:strand:- start:137 stop:355 length:219 start_codon:yes stop_codon:yes gene_type:complete